MSEERKILELLSSGQITVDEAEGLLEALRELPDSTGTAHETYLYSKAMQDRKKVPVALSLAQAQQSSKLFKIDIHRSGEEDKNLNFQVPVESALMMESFIPKDIKEIIAAQGFELGALLVSLNPNFPSGKILDMHVSDDEYDTNILLEVTS